MPTAAQLKRTLRTLQWSRGLRAGVAVSVAMTVCHLLHRPMGWAALGGFEAILVDNGGPYRSRFQTIGTLMTGGAAGCLIASLAASQLWLAVLAAALFCFTVTFARVLAQPIASTSVVILVIYFAGVGAAAHTLAATLQNLVEFVLGGAWAALLSLALWPLDPFRPARLAVAACYAELAAFTAALRPTPPHTEEREAQRQRTHAFQRALRLRMETARVALGATAARSASRTVRAHSLAVLLETADILFAETLRWTELAERADDPGSRAALTDAVRWLGAAERAIVAGLAHRPPDDAASFAPEGSHSLEHIRGRAAIALELQHAPGHLVPHLGADESDALQNLEIAFEAVRALWTGMELRALRPASSLGPHANAEAAPGYLDLLRAHCTRDSVTMRHALRIAIVGAVDVLLMPFVHVSHGSWLAMTSIIVLQPYGSGTLRKTAQRVGGTIAGGILAATLAVSIHSQAGIVAVITLTSIMTLATYAVDYGWYAFFLTPTFVLMSLPHLRDWRYAGVRMGNTVLGAAIALLAMRLLWPEREDLQLGRLLALAATALAGYLRAVLGFWEANPTTSAARRQAERAILAPARRAAGLAIAEAEETLDRLLLEPTLTRRAALDGRADALTFITYLRRLARSATTLAAFGLPAGSVPRLHHLAARLDALGHSLMGTPSAPAPSAPGSVPPSAASVGEQQMQRMERQVGILERAAIALHPPSDRRAAAPEPAATAIG